MLTQLSSTSTPPVVPPPCPAAKAASGASATASQTPPGTVPGVITDISAAARATAERESSEALQTPSSSNVTFDFMSEAKGRAIELGGQALTTLRPTLEITTEIASVS